jgi:hypothetical protein
LRQTVTSLSMMLERRTGDNNRRTGQPIHIISSGKHACGSLPTILRRQILLCRGCWKEGPVTTKEGPDSPFLSSWVGSMPVEASQLS